MSAAALLELEREDFIDKFRISENFSFLLRTEEVAVVRSEPSKKNKARYQ